MSKVKNIDDYRSIEDYIKLRTGAKSVVIGLVFDEGNLSTYIPDMADIDLVYAIQTLKDRRKQLMESNE